MKIFGPFLKVPRLAFFGLTLLLIASLGLTSDGGAQSQTTQANQTALPQLTIERGQGAAKSILTIYAVELALTPAQKERGLMYRQSLPREQGMLFYFPPRSTPISMWMANTYIGLDMIFADEAGTIIGWHEHAEPLSQKIITTPNATRWVLEVNDGEIARLQIQLGDRLIPPNIP